MHWKGRSIERGEWGAWLKWEEWISSVLQFGWSTDHEKPPLPVGAPADAILLNEF